MAAASVQQRARARAIALLVLALGLAIAGWRLSHERAVSTAIPARVGPAPLATLPILATDDVHGVDGDHLTLVSAARACTLAVDGGDLLCAPISPDLPARGRTIIPARDRRTAPAFAFLYDGRDFAIVRLADGAPVGDTAAFALPDPHATIVGDELVWHAGTPSHLFARRFDPSTVTFAPVVDAGVVDGGGSTDELCRAGDAAVFRAQRSLWFVAGDAWTAHADPPALVADDHSTRCTAGDATFTRLDATAGIVRTTTCTPELCKPERTSASLTKPSATRISGAAAMLGDNALLVLDNQRATPGVWMRLATLSTLAAAHDTQLLATPGHVAAILVDGAHALVVIRTDAGIGVIRVAADGSFAAVTR